jgi:uncharacterized phosphosugar-binding protein
MLIERYFSRLKEHIEQVEGQTPAIQQAAKLCADALERGGSLHIFDSGHMVSQELVHRAGGLAALNALTFQLVVNHVVRARPDNPQPASLSYSYIEHVFETNQLRPGDVLFVGSVSGKTPNVIELALQGRAHGLKVIVLTALSYSSMLESEHPSGKRLFECADLVIDNCAPFGDGMLSVEGLEYPVCPGSGIGAAVALWAVVAGTIEEMLGRGLTPTVYPSVNRPDGREVLERAYETARQKGY